MIECHWVCTGYPFGWLADPDQPHVCPVGQVCTPPNTICDEHNTGSLARTTCA